VLFEVETASSSLDGSSNFSRPTPAAVAFDRNLVFNGTGAGFVWDLASKGTSTFCVLKRFKFVGGDGGRGASSMLNTLPSLSLKTSRTLHWVAPDIIARAALATTGRVNRPFLFAPNCTSRPPRLHRIVPTIQPFALPPPLGFAEDFLELRREGSFLGKLATNVILTKIRLINAVDKSKKDSSARVHKTPK
jgi:hypothetical protein